MTRWRYTWPSFIWDWRIWATNWGLDRLDSGWPDNPDVQTWYLMLGPLEVIWQRVETGLYKRLQDDAA